MSGIGIPSETEGEVPVKEKSTRRTAIVAVLACIIVIVIVSVWWYTQPAPPTDEYETYSKYGFSFEYPTAMTMSEQGLLENTATDSSGIVVGELKNDEHELIFAGWLNTVVAPDLEVSLEGAFGGMVQSEGTTNLERGELVEATKAGHAMIYQYYTVTIEGEAFHGIYGVWYCETNQRFYQFNLMSTEEDTLPTYQRYLDSLVCH